MSNPMFQHRHYAALADMLADLRDPRENGGMEKPDRELAELARVEEAMVALFRRDNYGFKPERFRAAARRAPDMCGRDKL